MRLRLLRFLADWFYRLGSRSEDWADRLDEDFQVKVREYWANDYHRKLEALWENQGEDYQRKLEALRAQVAEWEKDG